MQCLQKPRCQTVQTVDVGERPVSSNDTRCSPSRAMCRCLSYVAKRCSGMAARPMGLQDGASKFSGVHMRASPIPVPMQRPEDFIASPDTPIVKLTKIPASFQDADNPDDCLLAEVDFKWLMAGQGWWIDTTRFHSDASYAAWFIGSAMASQSPALRASAACLLLRCEGVSASAPASATVANPQATTVSL